jgi:hypothetical protein
VRAEEKIALRIHGPPELPALIYLPGLHGDWTLVSSFRAAVCGRVRFVELTYPRTTSWTLDDYARGVVDALLERGITHGWLIGESFSSQVTWKILELSERDPRFEPRGLVLAGGFIRHPTIWGVHLVRRINAAVPAWVMRLFLRIYAAYARLRHRNAPETAASIEEFVARRTEADRQAILHRYTLISGNDSRGVARRCKVPCPAGHAHHHQCRPQRARHRATCGRRASARVDAVVRTDR